MSADKNEPKNAESETIKPIVIKKYSNRRLYDTSASKYIVLQDVVNLVNSGSNFIIEDAKSGEDITRTILNQVIFEQETQPKEFLFPLEFQKQLIRMYGDSYGHLIPDFLTQSITFFAAERKEMTTAWQDMMARNTDKFLKQSEALARQNMETFRRAWDVFGVMQTADEKSEAQKNEPDDQTKTIAKLQSQIDALQDQIKNLK
jgi:polyhydroxyalkanoate synthesis repressor PhaR